MKVREMGRKAYQTEELPCKNLEVRMCFTLWWNTMRDNVAGTQKTSSLVVGREVRKCYGLSICVASQILTLKVNAQCDNTRRWSFAELIRS